MTQPTGIHHLAISTNDTKAQITFCTQVLGMELVALYWMHGVDRAFHSFLRLNDQCSLTFVEMAGRDKVPGQLGLSHAANAGSPSAAGTMQHVAFRVDTLDALLAMRDRIRSHGVPVFGPIDHGMCHSIYFAGPEGLNLEVATSAAPIAAEAWIDPEVVALCGIDADELAAMKKPGAFTRPDAPVPQPAYDPAKPHLRYPEDVYARMLSVPDDAYAAARSYNQPPVKAPAA